MKKGKIYGLLGDGGSVTSEPFEQYVRHMQSPTCQVDIIYDSGRDTGKVCADIISEDRDCNIILLGYSLGANGCAWVQKALVPWCKMLKVPLREIALIVGFDPTQNSRLDIFPIGAHVKRCLCFHQTSYLYPSTWLYGHGVYSRDPDGPQIEVTLCKASHLWVQSEGGLRALCTTAVNSTLA